MSAKNYIAPLLLLSFLIIAPLSANAGPYVSLGLGANHRSVDTPNLLPSHPVSAVEQSRSETNIGFSLGAGYRWHSWYTEISAVDLGSPSRNDRRTGENATSTFQTFSRREEHARGLEWKLGRFFPLTNAVSIFSEIGVHRYRNKITESISTTETDKSSDLATSSHSEFSVTDRDSDILVGIGIAKSTPAVTLKFSVLHYSGIDSSAVMLVTLFGL